MKKYLLLSLLILMEPLFSGSPSIRSTMEKENDPVHNITILSSENVATETSEEQEDDAEEQEDDDMSAAVSSFQNNQEMTISSFDHSALYSQGSIKANDNTKEQSSSMESNSQALLENFTNSKNKSVTSASYSPLKNLFTWWNSRTSEQKDALIKTGFFLGGCAVAYLFPQYTITERLLILLCLPCFIELGETAMTTVSSFS